MKDASSQISLSPSAITRVLGAMAGLLVLASIGGQLSKFVLDHGSLKGLVPLFNLNDEYNIPTYFSVLLMLFISLLLSIITVLSRKQRVPHVSKWAILSFGFLCMAYDEAFRVHEKLVFPVRAILSDGDLGIFYFAWVVPGIALVLVLFLFFWNFLLYLDAATRFRFLLSATLYLGGAVGIELIGGRHAELHGEDNLMYNMIVTVEETLEMAGLVTFIWTLLTYYAEKYSEVRFRLDT